MAAILFYGFANPFVTPLTHKVIRGEADMKASALRTPHAASTGGRSGRNPLDARTSGGKRPAQPLRLPRHKLLSFVSTHTNGWDETNDDAVLKKR